MAKAVESDYQVVAPLECLGLVKSATDNAQSRVLGGAMYLEGGSLTRQYIVDPFGEAARRGLAEVVLQIDGFTHSTTSGHNRIFDEILRRSHLHPLADLMVRLALRDSFYSAEALRARAQQQALNEKMFDQLEKSGVKVVVVNDPRKSFAGRMLHWRGRCHDKAFISDHTVAAIPCFNFGDADYTRPDLAIITYDPRVVEGIWERFRLKREGDRGDDFEIKCTDNTSLLVDVGRPTHSKILQHALSIVEGAKRDVIFSSQMVPDGEMKKVLLKAQERAVDVKIAVPDWRTMTDPLLRAGNLVKTMSARRSGLRMLLFDKWIHAKFLAADGKVALAGSHTFSKSAIDAGTGEMNLLSTDKRLVEELYNFHNNLV